MAKYKISIIIPVYNAELYIANCLDSIINSNLPKDNYEIVVVNDGSTDRSEEIIQSYLPLHNNISYLVQQNTGQSGARNNGIKSCQGEYVWCVDADDKLSGNWADLFSALASYPYVDILAFKLNKVTEQGESKGFECSQPTVVHNQIIKGRDAIISGYNPSSVCALLIRKSLMTSNELFFRERITHQDVELSYRLFAHAGDVVFTDIAPYIYILHPNSTSQSIKPEKKIKYLSDDIVIINSFKALAESFKKSDETLYTTIQQRVKNVQLGMVLNLYSNKAKWAPLGISQAVIEAMKKADLYPLKGDFGSFKKNILKRVLNYERFIY